MAAAAMAVRQAHPAIDASRPLIVPFLCRFYRTPVWRRDG
jgi:hypothetical protein